jgi:hypothetical protein
VGWVQWSKRTMRMRPAISSGAAYAQFFDQRLMSSSAAGPLSWNRSIHLYPVFRATHIYLAPFCDAALALQNPRNEL